MAQKQHQPTRTSAIRMIAMDLDGTLLGASGRVSPRNMAALRVAEEAGVEIVIATGRRHCYALHVLRELELKDKTILISSNGAVVRTIGSELLERTLMHEETVRWLCGYLGEFRNALVITFDKVGVDGEDARGALVVEDLADLHSSIGRWMETNEPYIERVCPIENALQGDAPIQMMICGTLERMRRAEALMLADGRISSAGANDGGEISLSHTEYPERDLSLVDILPAGCSKGAALLRLAAARGMEAREIMAIGDNWNDVSMLEVAGTPVLMSNAPPELRLMADERGWLVTADHDADGVAEAILSLLAIHV